MHRVLTGTRTAGKSGGGQTKSKELNLHGVSSRTRLEEHAHRFSSPMTRVQRSFILPIACMQTLGATCHETGLYDGRPSSIGVSSGPARKVYKGE